MPTYEYRCEAGHIFEEFQSMLADPIQSCPLCGSHAERVMSGGSGLIFKGSGFYVTDYAHKNRSGGSNSKSGKSYASEAASDSRAESAPASASETKPDSTPAPKTEEKKSKPEG